MALDQEDLLAIDGIVGRHVQDIAGRVGDHEITLYGPDRSNGLRSTVDDLKKRQDRADARWYKLVAITAALQLLLTLGGYILKYELEKPHSAGPVSHNSLDTGSSK